MEIYLKVGASPTSRNVTIDLEDGRSVEASAYSVELSVGEHMGASLVVAFEAARPVLGSEFLEDMGLWINSKSGLLEPSRDPRFPRECEE